MSLSIICLMLHLSFCDQFFTIFLRILLPTSDLKKKFRFQFYHSICEMAWQREATFIRNLSLKILVKRIRRKWHSCIFYQLNFRNDWIWNSESEWELMSAFYRFNDFLSNKYKICVKTVCIRWTVSHVIQSKTNEY